MLKSSVPRKDKGKEEDVKVVRTFDRHDDVVVTDAVSVRSVVQSRTHGVQYLAGRVSMNSAASDRVWREENTIDDRQNIYNFAKHNMNQRGASAGAEQQFCSTEAIMRTIDLEHPLETLGLLVFEPNFLDGIQRLLSTETDIIRRQAHIHALWTSACAGLYPSISLPFGTDRAMRSFRAVVFILADGAHYHTLVYYPYRLLPEELNAGKLVSRHVYWYEGLGVRTENDHGMYAQDTAKAVEMLCTAGILAHNCILVDMYQKINYQPDAYSCGYRVISLVGAIADSLAVVHDGGFPSDVLLTRVTDARVLHYPIRRLYYVQQLFARLCASLKVNDDQSTKVAISPLYTPGRFVWSLSAIPFLIYNASLYERSGFLPRDQLQDLVSLQRHWLEREKNMLLCRRVPTATLIHTRIDLLIDESGLEVRLRNPTVAEHHLLAEKHKELDTNGAYVFPIASLVPDADRERIYQQYLKSRKRTGTILSREVHSALINTSISLLTISYTLRTHQLPEQRHLNEWLANSACTKAISNPRTPAVANACRTLILDTLRLLTATVYLKTPSHDDASGTHRYETIRFCFDMDTEYYHRFQFGKLLSLGDVLLDTQNGDDSAVGWTTLCRMSMFSNKAHRAFSPPTRLQIYLRKEQHSRRPDSAEGLFGSVKHLYPDDIVEKTYASLKKLIAVVPGSSVRRKRPTQYLVQDGVSIDVRQHPFAYMDARLVNAYLLHNDTLLKSPSNQEAFDGLLSAEEAEWCQRRQQLFWRYFENEDTHPLALPPALKQLMQEGASRDASRPKPSTGSLLPLRTAELRFADDLFRRIDADSLQKDPLHALDISRRLHLEHSVPFVCADITDTFADERLMKLTTTFMSFQLFSLTRFLRRSGGAFPPVLTSWPVILLPEQPVAPAKQPITVPLVSLRWVQFERVIAALCSPINSSIHQGACGSLTYKQFEYNPVRALGLSPPDSVLETQSPIKYALRQIWIRCVHQQEVWLDDRKNAGGVLYRAGLEEVLSEAMIYRRLYQRIREYLGEKVTEDYSTSLHRPLNVELTQDEISAKILMLDRYFI